MMAKTFSEKVLNPFFDSESRRRAQNITSINDQMGNTLRGEKRTRYQTRTKETPQPKKMAPNEMDSDVELEEYENEADFMQTIPQSDLQLSDSILVLSTIHPPALLGTPRSKAIEEQPATGMDAEVTSSSLAREPSAPRMDGEQLTSTPNLSPVSSPTKQLLHGPTATAPPLTAPPFLPVPLCPPAADFYDRASLPAAATTTDFTSSQRLILPTLGSPLSIRIESDSECEDAGATVSRSYCSPGWAPYCCLPHGYFYRCTPGWAPYCCLPHDCYYSGRAPDPWLPGPQNN